MDNLHARSMFDLGMENKIYRTAARKSMLTLVKLQSLVSEY